MQRIEVESFGPLKNIDLEIKDYMVFIGPQASGKSTLAELIYFFWKVEDKFNQEILSTYVLNKILNTHREEVNYIENWKKFIRKLFSDIFPTYRNGVIRFTYKDNYHITFNVVSLTEKFNDDVIISEGFKSDINEVDRRINASPALSRLLREKKFPVEDLLEVFSREFLLNGYQNNQNIALKRIFIPAGRGILGLFANSLALVDSNILDYFNSDFVGFANEVRKFIKSGRYEEHFGWTARLTSENNGSIYSLGNQISFDILKGDFHTDNKGDGIMHYYNGSGYVIPLKHTSSGQQESIWLINVIQYLLINPDENKYDVIIEEPEAHLYPDAQRDITNLITLSSNHTKGRFIVTTHSPYILATLNNSIKAFNVAREGKADEVEAILSKELWIDSKNLFVGFMEKVSNNDSYGIEDIFDSELGLIKHEVLDQVSDDIMNQFDELLNIQYN
jgi:predicted ATPase